MKKILLVVDMQNDFITGPLGNEDCKAVVEPIRKLITEQSWDTIRFTADEHIKANDDDSRYKETIEGRTIPPHCIPGTDGFEIVPELKPLCTRPTITKDTFGDFHVGATIQYDVEKMVWNSYTNRGAEYEIHVVGVCTSICVLSNVAILRSEFPSAKIIIHENCTADVTKEKKTAALECMKSILCEVV